ncbi:N-acylneuraminate cytidylyltransferase A-like isoform X2 [Daphnia pulex]|uniref:N-acylneuraminate cytidylyltransferase A-like isoform X2 n=1 Tax=Daphnia pulex TaxID=6669 RepID=UPI001EDCC39B|nr:N-acylneuraminate cytidylyltransferase A-like isoform X2 [Daphnia pulex]
MTMHVAGLILARGGSKGIPLKNLALLKGTPLLLWALRTMSQCKGLTSIWVSSDHPDILQLALENGAQVHRRSAETSSDGATSLEAINEFLASHPEVDVVALIQCTSPFVRVAHLNEAIAKMTAGCCDSVFSVTRSHSLRWMQLAEPKIESSSSGSGRATVDAAEIRAVNFDPHCRPKRQDWNGDLVENGAFYLSSVQLLRQGLIQGGKISFVEMSAECSIDIDTGYDLWLAEQQASYFNIEPGGGEYIQTFFPATL